MFNKFKSAKYIILVLVILSVLSVAGCQKAEESKEIVAKLGDVEITKDEFYDILVEQYGEETLDGMISAKIIELEIEKFNIEVSQEEVDEEYAKMENYYGGPEVLAQTMEQYNMTREDMEKNIKSNLSMKKLVADDVEVTEEEIKEFYAENGQIFGKEASVNASHILVDTEELANEVLGKLDEGESFEDLALEYSIDGSAANGGNLGVFGRGEMVEPFDEAAFSLPVGEISEPVQSNFGYHIIKVNEKVEEEIGSLEDNKDEIKEMILESKIPEAFNAWYEAKMTEYNVMNSLKE